MTLVGQLLTHDACRGWKRFHIGYPKHMSVLQHG